MGTTQRVGTCRFLPVRVRLLPWFPCRVNGRRLRPRCSAAPPSRGPVPGALQQFQALSAGWAVWAFSRLLPRGHGAVSGHLCRLTQIVVNPITSSVLGNNSCCNEGFPLICSDCAG